MGELRDGAIVVTVYGHGHEIDKFTVSIFSSDPGLSRDNADTYCRTINSLELKEGSWIIAKNIPENTPIDFKNFLPYLFEEVILKLDNIAIQKVLREGGSNYISGALIGASDDVKERVFANMSRKTSQTIKEDLEENMGQMDLESILSYRNRILEVVHNLAHNGEITIGEDKEGYYGQ